jgi:hypothetical protein
MLFTVLPVALAIRATVSPLRTVYVVVQFVFTVQLVRVANEISSPDDSGAAVASSVAGSVAVTIMMIGVCVGAGVGVFVSVGTSVAVGVGAAWGAHAAMLNASNNRIGTTVMRFISDFPSFIW